MAEDAIEEGCLRFPKLLILVITLLIFISYVYMLILAYIYEM